jgi:hypothetical protein
MKQHLSLEKYLRQNKARKNGLPGSYSIRLLWLFDKRMAPKRIERGLGTNDKVEALERANILLRFIYSLGHAVSNRIYVSVPRGRAVKLRKALPDYQSTIQDLPLFSQQWADLPPFAEVENTRASR